MYQVLYRKWRPKKFDDVVGQEHIVATLKNELKSNHIAHAYLFTGSRGTGKTTCAKILSKAVNCLNLIDGNPCGECETCVGIDSGSILDVVEIDAASNNGVENVRAIREEAVFSPSVCKYRVYIIDEVHMLSIGAFNALLKILEEPPEHVIFILATTEVHKIPATILSRCQRFDFHRIKNDIIANRIIEICEKENVEITNDAAMIISSISDGAMRDALSILDQCIGTGKVIDREFISGVVGISGTDHVVNIINLLLEKNIKEILSIIEKLYMQSKSMVRLCEELIKAFRDIMLIFNGVDLDDNLYGSNIEKIKSYSNKLSLDSIINYIDNLQYALDKMMKGYNNKLELEKVLIKLCNEESNLKNIEERIKKLENIFLSGKTYCKTLSSEKEVKVNNSEKQLDNCIEDNKDVNCEAKPMEKWDEILEILKKNTSAKSMSIAFRNSKAYENGNFILIDSDSSLAFELLRDSVHRDELRSAIKLVTGKVYNLGPYKKIKNNLDNNSDILDGLYNKAKEENINIKLN